MIIPILAVRYHTFTAIFYPVFCIGEIATAILPQGVKRTITEKAVEKPLIRFMTRVIFTLFILKIGIVIFHIITIGYYTLKLVKVQG